MTNSKRLFYGSCFALITTAFSFSIRAGILPQLAETFSLSGQQLGFINSMWFLGFPISMILGGLFYHTIGPKRIMQFAFFTHTLGIILTIFSGGYTGLLVSTLLIGIGNGCTEAACNPMIADAYEGKQMNTLLNRFHMWFPGGIVLGSLVSLLMTTLDLGWQAQIWIIMIPTLIYAYLFMGQEFPKPKIEGVTSISENFKAMLSPIYIFILACMALTAISEFGPQQWTSLILSNSGAHPMVILALITGLMAIGRYFGGDIVHKFDQTGVLLGSAILTAIGIFLLSTQTGGMVYVAAVFFALGVCYFWPNMIGFVAEKIPLSGALGMSIVGGMGMFSSSIFQAIIGGWIDSSTAEQAALGLTGTDLELAAGQQTLTYMISFPAILIVLFTILYFWQRNAKVSATA
ncbi:MFS transporter [Flavobacteriaceae bacterium]|jgi:putative MFS transporter|nr:MFS transporter [Flavobacteriaceae bacterium]MDA9124296.1 MFS transporter [bacterium]MBT4314080.1 MFS transporter [Flavobacteriaceae bacterium]MBT5092117.1 MFS transporter [Flavobacteriaceae bacterium]MBT5283579.1 MFS transporter [Flavobacteriaceae bacterium]|tara:strand:- start:14815 stop:16026 length:1212 start_codon:yes stop_codon:yes gene_type:complete